MDQDVKDITVLVNGTPQVGRADKGKRVYVARLPGGRPMWTHKACAVCAVWFLVPTLAPSINQSTVVREEVSLKSGDNTITAVILENTHQRTYKKQTLVDSSTDQECRLNRGVEGVLWKIVFVGAFIEAEEIQLEDNLGREFRETCWTRKSFVMGGDIQTEILAVGPDDSTVVTVTFGDEAVEIKIEEQ